jgi:hypothetical protein
MGSARRGSNPLLCIIFFFCSPARSNNEEVDRMFDQTKTPGKDFTQI